MEKPKLSQQEKADALLGSDLKKNYKNENFNNKISLRSVFKRNQDIKIVENTLKYLMNVKQNNSWTYGFDKYISKAFETLKLLNESKYAYK